MIVTSKIAVVSGAAVCAVLAVLLMVFVRGAVSQRGVKSYEGYYAPVYSPDGQYVYFLQRSISGTVEQTSPPALFSAPKFDVTVTKDSFILKRLHVEKGDIEELRRLPPSPAEGRRSDEIGNPFPLPSTRLRFTEDHQLEFEVCLTLDHGSDVKKYMSSGVWTGGAAEIMDAWKASACMLGGYNEWPLFGDSELLEVRGRQYFPVAIVAYNHVKRTIRVLVKNEDYDKVYPDGVPLKQILENSRRPDMERTQTVRRVYKELNQKYKAMGMSDNQAGLRAGKEMQRLGYFPKSTMIVARRLHRAAASKVDKAALFRIAKGEMESGIFHDIEQAIARPGEEIDKGFGGYNIHRDYSTSARLNKFLEAGNTRFYVEYLGATYELTILPP